MLQGNESQDLCISISKMAQTCSFIKSDRQELKCSRPSIYIKLIMSGNKHRDPSHQPFFREKDSFKTRVQFRDSQILIQFQHIQSSDAFSVTITQADMQKSAILMLVFVSTESLFFALKDNYDFVTIRQGEIQLKIGLEMMGRKSKNIVTLYGSKVEACDATDYGSLFSELDRTMTQYNAKSQLSLQQLRNQTMNIHQKLFKEAPPPNNYPIFQYPQSPNLKPKDIRKTSPSILPVSQERIVRSPTIVEKKQGSSQSQACKCSIM